MLRTSKGGIIIERREGWKPTDCQTSGKTGFLRHGEKATEAEYEFGKHKA
jgi:hypothetical protein